MKKEIDMKININTKYDISIVKATIALCGLLVLFMVLGSPVAVAETTTQSPEVAPISEEFINYQNKEIPVEPEPSLDGHQAGLVPEPVDLDYLSDISVGKESFPVSYDLRTLNRVTPVRDQGSAGTCWAFASYASLESFLKPGENWDLSENNMKNLLSSAYSEGFDRGPNDGGNRFQAAAYLTRWTGPVDESDDPYIASSISSPEGLPLKKHVQNVLFIPKRTGFLDNEVIKWAVQNYGAIYTSMYYNNTFYSPLNYSYYYNGTLVPNHAVAIVGWDDSFDRNKFTEVPPGDGAFIMKNSWGSDWGENGYFYVSYYDSKVGNENSVFTAENTDNYESIYQYDPLGWTNSLGYSNVTAWCANVFTARSDEVLKAVGFYTTDSNCNYEIYIYTDPVSGPVNQAGPVLSKSGRSLTAGYNTIPLDSDIRLTTGQKFSVVLKLTNSAYKYPIAMERPITDWSSKAKANSGESFISGSGQTWKDIVGSGSYPNTNVCIKAFADPVLLPVANFRSDVTEGYAPLTVKFDDLSENAAGWNWDFENDGNIDSTDENPVYVYANPGSYTVNLTVSNENGTDSKLGTINVSEKPIMPVANFSSNVTVGYAPMTVQFNDSSEKQVSLSWDFENDGVIDSNVKNPVHLYSVPGTYTVNLTAINGNGTDSKLSAITVLKQTLPPVAKFYSNVTQGYAPLPVQFTDISENATERYWDFGDGTHSSAVTPVHVYQAGKYAVSLTVMNGNGMDTETKSKYITVTKKK